MSGAMPAPKRSPLGRLDPVAKRLRQLRAAVEPELPASAFAEKYGFGATQWYNFENGYPLSKGAALTLCQKIPGLNPYWLWEGDTGGLTVELFRKLEAVENAG